LGGVKGEVLVRLRDHDDLLLLPLVCGKQHCAFAVEPLLERLTPPTHPRELLAERRDERIVVSRTDATGAATGASTSAALSAHAFPMVVPLGIELCGRLVSDERRAGRDGNGSGSWRYLCQRRLDWLDPRR
jgi:hypothetical protein